MKCKILHTSPGRVRVHMMQNRMTLEQADILEYYLLSIPGILPQKFMIEPVMRSLSTQQTGRRFWMRWEPFLMKSTRVLFRNRQAAR